MTKAIEHPTTSRRALLAGIPAAALVGAVAAPAVAAAQPSPDAELIALCEEYLALDRAFCANCAAGAHMLATDPEWDALYEAGCAMVPRLHELEAEIATWTAETPEGLRALVQAARHSISSDAEAEDAGDERDLLTDTEVAWAALDSALAMLDAGEAGVMGKHSPGLRLVEGAASAASDLPLPMSAAFASLLLLAPVEAGASKAVELDTELLACCATARRAADAVMDRLDDATLDDPDVLDVLARMRPQLDAYFDAVGRAAELPARTPEGLRAKAALLLLHIHSGEDHTALAASLACDMAGRQA